MWCESCGATVDPSTFCPGCGSRLTHSNGEPLVGFADTESSTPLGRSGTGRSRKRIVGAVAAASTAGLLLLGFVVLGASSAQPDTRAVVAAAPTSSSGPTEATTSTTTFAAASVETIAGSTTSVDTTSSSPVEAESPELPLGFGQSLDEATLFRYSFASIQDLPDLPSEVGGHVAYDGIDDAGLTGFVRSGTLRVFAGEDAYVTLPQFSTQANGCNDAFWVARWVVQNPDVRVVATNELDRWSGAAGDADEGAWLLPPEAPAGMMGASICTAPGFQFHSTVNDDAATLVDVSVEWAYFDRDPFADAGTATPASSIPASVTCSGYSDDDQLPISVCAQGTSVAFVQFALGLDDDGYFGPGTQQAIVGFQEAVGLPVNGIIDSATWAALGLNDGVPFPDLNGDGSIDFSEHPFD